MHYLIDGYNLLFKLAWHTHTENLQSARVEFIKALDNQVSILRVDVIIVFDAPMQTEELRRSHFNSLEVVFTAKGQTADDYLIDTFTHLKKPTEYTLVTSDKRLQRLAKEAGLHIEPAESFLHHLKKRCQKKKQKLLLQTKSPKKEITTTK